MNASSRIGVDIDGVLADFNNAFIYEVIMTTGEDLFPVRPFDIPCWNYPQHYGYTEAQVSEVWENIKNNPNFWYELCEYPMTFAVMAQLQDLQQAGAEIYFITARPGTVVKKQTEMWLDEAGFPNATVLISSAKGMCARALNLTHYIDDRWENVVDVRQYQPLAAVSLLTQPWNVNNDAAAQGVRRVSSVLEFLQPNDPTATVDSMVGAGLRSALQGGRSL